MGHEARFFSSEGLILTLKNAMLTHVDHTHMHCYNNTTYSQPRLKEVLSNTLLVRFLSFCSFVQFRKHGKLNNDDDDDDDNSILIYLHANLTATEANYKVSMTT
jgi:hypothetical protein